MNRNHFVIYRDINGVLSELPTVQFAQENRNFFNGIPQTPMEVNRILVLNHGFTLIANDEKVICYKIL
jgi:hypothetical protein